MCVQTCPSETSGVSGPQRTYNLRIYCRLAAWQVPTQPLFFIPPRQQNQDRETEYHITIRAQPNTISHRPLYTVVGAYPHKIRLFHGYIISFVLLSTASAAIYYSTSSPAPSPPHLSEHEGRTDVEATVTWNGRCRCFHATSDTYGTRAQNCRMIDSQLSAAAAALVLGGSDGAAVSIGCENRGLQMSAEASCILFTIAHCAQCTL